MPQSCFRHRINHSCHYLTNQHAASYHLPFYGLNQVLKQKEQVAAQALPEKPDKACACLTKLLKA